MLIGLLLRVPELTAYLEKAYAQYQEVNKNNPDEEDDIDSGELYQAFLDDFNGVLQSHLNLYHGEGIPPTLVHYNETIELLVNYYFNQVYLEQQAVCRALGASSPLRIARIWLKNLEGDVEVRWQTQELSMTTFPGLMEAVC